LRAGSGRDDKSYQALLQESVAMGGTPVLAPTIPPAADSDKPLVTVVVSSEGVESYKDRPIFMPELSAEPTRFDRFPSPGGDEATAPGTAESGSVKVATILFDDGSAQIGSRELDILRKVTALQRQRGGTIRVVGHASSRTRNMDSGRHRSVNYQISVERASAVARELAKLGVPSETIVVSAMADEQPVYHEVMPSGEAGNRRAEIYIDY
jgi:outer membrane protein OmpA-like peptidoglycan-associated protein